MRDVDRGRFAISIFANLDKVRTELVGLEIGVRAAFDLEAARGPEE